MRELRAWIRTAHVADNTDPAHGHHTIQTRYRFTVEGAEDLRTLSLALEARVEDWLRIELQQRGYTNIEVIDRRFEGSTFIGGLGDKDA